MENLTSDQKIALFYALHYTLRQNRITKYRAAMESLLELLRASEVK